MLKRLLFLIFVMLAGASTANAAELCNETSYIVHVSSGWPVEGGVAIEGWERVRPGECRDIANGADLDGNEPIFYYAKTSEAYPGGVREWRGQVSLCVDEADFEVVANTRCAALGLASRPFMVREGASRERTVLVEAQRYDRSFRSSSTNAGLQRLLQAAGYNVLNVDGIAGSGTRRAISSFLEDAGIDARPGDLALMDALEERALQRNATSGLTLCNESRTDISAALGHRVGETWQSRGWWRMHSGECARMLATRLDNADTFFYAERINSDMTGSLVGGDNAFCVAPARYLAEGREACEDRGYGTARFRQIPNPEDGGVRVTLTDADFEG